MYARLSSLTEQWTFSAVSAASDLSGAVEFLNRDLEPLSSQGVSETYSRSIVTCRHDGLKHFCKG